MLLAHNIGQGQRTRDVRISEDITFDTMLLTSNTLDGLKKSGFIKPSPIQLHGIPLGKCGFDLLLEAKSGTGKTAVFTVIALEKLDLRNGLQAVILAPTREIAAQICDVIKQIGSNYKALKVEVVMGGLPVQEDISKFKRKDVHIVVGSPGRLRHLIQEKYITTSAVRLLVLDEADKLMEKSFQADINYIFSVLPKQKQVIMSSATYPEITKTFIEKYVQNAQHIQPDSNSVLLGVEQKVITVKYNSNIVKQTQHRFEELLKILSKKQFKQCLIFCNYQARVKELHKMLTREKWPAEQLYGQQEQIERLDALKTLQEYKCRILISTDLAARGIDASNVDLVVNFEPPIEWQTYLHRIGRAGRFGSYGIAVTILSEGKEEKKFKEILESLNVSSTKFWRVDGLNIIDEDYDECSLSPQISEIPIDEPLMVCNDVRDKCKKIWDAFTYDNTMQNRREIETFETLCKSFKEFNIDSKTIEPFTALVNSFHRFEHEGNINEKSDSHKLLKTQVMYVKECFGVGKSGKKLETIPKKNEKSYHIVKEIDNTEHLILTKDLNENGKNSEYLGLKEEISVRSNVKEINNKEVPWPPYTPENYFENHEQSHLRYENEPEFETADATEALRRAGLPTSFGKLKTHYKRNRGKNNYTEYPSHEVYRIHEECSEKYKQNKFNKTVKSNVQSHETKLLHSSEDLYQANQKYFPSCSDDFQTGQRYSSDSLYNDNGYDTLSRHYSKSNSNATYTKHGNKTKGITSSHNNKKYSNQYSVPQVDDSDSDNANSSERLYQNYLLWYNQLKMRVKQIELAVYIDELSKS